MEVKMRCDDCKAVAWCKEAFGKYWPEKSHNGEGCTCPLPQDGRYSPLTITKPTRRPLPVRKAQGELKLINLVDKFRKAQKK